MLVYRKGDLIQAFKNGKVDTIVHGCNCYCTMGAGIAKQIKNEFPKAYESDVEFDKLFPTDLDKKHKLGHYSSCKTEFGIIVNAYTQDTYWDTKRLLSYEAIKDVFELIKKDFPYNKIGIPRIGCGLAKGDWNKVSSIIESIFDYRTIYVYDL